MFQTHLLEKGLKPRILCNEICKWMNQHEDRSGGPVFNCLLEATNHLVRIPPAGVEVELPDRDIPSRALISSQLCKAFLSFRFLSIQGISPAEESHKLAVAFIQLDATFEASDGLGS